MSFLVPFSLADRGNTEHLPEPGLDRAQGREPTRHARPLPASSDGRRKPATGDVAARGAEDAL